MCDRRSCRSGYEDRTPELVESFNKEYKKNYELLPEKVVQVGEYNINY